MNSEPTFLWHDYETFGTHPQLDRPAQFAAVRTDQALRPRGEPINWYCRPAVDVLPRPEACLVTGITPQHALAEGLPEAEFAARIHAEMMEPGTCSVGYNNIRFDDEFSRNLFYRNFLDPYEREYRNDNSRWDLIDLMRMCYALRPEGIEWPRREDGTPSFKLEDLSRANRISHEGAHEALADVMATIALARLLRSVQPRLFDWALQMRDQRRVMQLLDPAKAEPVLHSSARIPASRGCTSLVLPLAIYPDRAKSVIVFDLMGDPEPLLELGADAITDRVFTAAADLPDDVDRVALKAIHTNHVPMIAPATTLKDADCTRIGLDVERCLENAAKLKSGLEQVRGKVMDVFRPQPFEPDGDPDHMLYSGGFFSRSDRRLMDRVRQSDPARLAGTRWPFEDARLPEMLFRYRARNFPDTLNASEAARWQQERLARLARPADERQLTPAAYAAAIAAARQSCPDDGPKQVILDQLEAWGRQICRAA
ncbi:MAG: exodeoxyribonuclease I [Lysobacterales bacterium]|jgi:exodeoxyribonuclease-1